MPEPTSAYAPAPLPEPRWGPEPASPPAPEPAAPAAAAATARPARSIVRLAAAFYGVASVFAAGYALFSGTLATLFGETWPSLGHLLSATAMGIGVVLLCHLGDRLWPPLRRAGEALTELLGDFGAGQALLLAAMSGFAEELLFRGALWPHLGLWGTSLLFALVHVIPSRRLLLYPAFALAVGLLLGLLRSGSGSVLPSMWMHALINGSNLIWLGRRRAKAAAAAAAAASGR